MNTSCLFCRIVAGEIPSARVFEDEQVMGFRDINPAAPQHILLIPKKHIRSVATLDKEDAALMGHLLLCARTVAEQEGFTETGFRSVLNTGQDGGQTVDHLHLHLLAGRQLHWPPG